MTKEQEAIEMLEDIKNNTWTTKYIMSSDSKKAETALNMLKEKDKELDIKEEQIEYIKNEYGKTIEEQGKQIDLMAEQLAGLVIWNNEKEEPIILGNKEEVKQYFERKESDGRN